MYYVSQVTHVAHSYCSIKYTTMSNMSAVLINMTNQPIKAIPSRTHSRRSSVTDINSTATIQSLQSLQSQLQRISQFNSTLENENIKLLHLIESSNNITTNELIVAYKFSNQQKYQLLEYRFNQLKQQYDTAIQQNIDIQCKLDNEKQSNANDRQSHRIVDNAIHQLNSLDISSNRQTIDELHAENLRLSTQVQITDNKLQETLLVIESLEQRLIEIFDNSIQYNNQLATPVNSSTIESVVTPKNNISCNKQKYNSSTLLVDSPLSIQSESNLLNELGVSSSERINPSAMWLKLCESNRRLELQDDAYRATIKQLQSHNQLLQQQIHNTSDEVSQQQQQYQADIAAVEQKLSFTQNALQECKQQLDVLQDTTNSTINQHINTIQQLNQQLATKQQHLDQYEIDMKQLQSVNDTLTDKCTSQSTQLATAQNELLSMTTQHNVASQQLYDAQIDYKSQIYDLQSSMTELHQQITMLHHSISDKEHQLNQATSEYNNHKTISSQQITALNNDIAHKQTELNELSRQLQLKTDALNVYHQQIIENAQHHAKRQLELDQIEKDKNAHKIKYALTELKNAIFDKPIPQSIDQSLWHIDPITGRQVCHTLTEEVAVALSTRVQQLEAEKNQLMYSKSSI